MQDKVLNFFENYITQEPLFVNKKALQANFTPETILYRDHQIQQIAQILAPSLRLEKPSNLFIYGETGTGKTVSIDFTTTKIKDVAGKNNVPVKIVYLNCKLKRVADTEYRLAAQLARNLGRDVPPTGLPTDEIYKILFNLIDSQEQLVILILDEIDQLVKKIGDEILYNLTRINTELKKAQISIIGISNDVVFRDNLDPRIKSSLSEEYILFPPYDALQLQEILRQRSEIAFKKGAVEAGVIEKCAAYAAQEHGDARRALELLRVSGEIAERKAETTIKLCHIDEAEDKIEKDRLLDMIKIQTKQHQATLYSVIAIYSKRRMPIFTGEIYDLYKEICLKTGLRPLTQRRVSDIIAELDMIGIINAQVISKGRYGRTREISLAIPKSSEDNIKKILEEGLKLT